MKKYTFYGNDVDLKDKYGLTPRDYYDLLLDIWCAETCAPRMRHEWSKDNPTRGQCSITAFLMQDFYGGKVMGIPIRGGNYHCFNEIDGSVFDLTSEQFGDRVLDYTNCVEQSRTIHFSKEEKKSRYEYLKRTLNEHLKLRKISKE